MYHELPRDASFWLFLFSVDQDLAETARQKACPCGGRLHRANYPRKPRGGPDRLLETELAEMPSAEATKAAAMLTRLQLMVEHQGKDWRELPHDEIQRFLFHLFGPSKRGSERGIFLSLNKKGQIVATFRGQVEFYHTVENGRAISKALAIETNTANKALRREYEKGIQEANEERDLALQEISTRNDVLKPCTPHLRKASTDRSMTGRQKPYLS